MKRKSIDLNGPWLFLPDFYGEGDDATFHAPEWDDSGWLPVSVPSEFGTCLPELEFYEGVGWFRRRAVIPAEWTSKHVVLRFEGVNQRARVWVNGELVGENFDSFLPFEFPVSSLLKYGEENVLVVRADNTRHAEDVPGEQRGWRTTGGILRDVCLVASDPLHLGHVAILADVDGKLKITAAVSNLREASAQIELHAEVLSGDDSPCADFTSASVALPAGQTTEIHLEGDVPDVSAWTPASPALYAVALSLRDPGDTVDAKSYRIGFRSIEASKGQLLLNGEPVTLLGFNRHEHSLSGGMVPDPETTRSDLEHMKAMGSNFVRLCHYPHDSSELDLCDELGLLVMDEVPLYWWAGQWEDEAIYQGKLSAAKRQVETMIRRDINHPSVIFWSVSNETSEKAPGVVEGNDTLVQLAKNLDSSRMAVHVTNHWTEVKAFDFDDVMCLNGYPAWGNRGKSNQGEYRLEDARHWWESEMKKLHEQYPEKPILVAEFGHPSLTGTRDGVMSEEAQSAALKAEFAGMQAAYVCGATIWCYADHPWPGGFDFMRFITTAPYGVVAQDRKRLHACDTVERMFKKPPPSDFSEA